MEKRNANKKNLGISFKTNYKENILEWVEGYSRWSFNANKTPMLFEKNTWTSEQRQRSQVVKNRIHVLKNEGRPLVLQTTKDSNDLFLSKIRIFIALTNTAWWEQKPIHKDTSTVIVGVIGQQPVPFVFLFTRAITIAPACWLLASWMNRYFPLIN